MCVPPPEDSADVVVFRVSVGCDHSHSNSVCVRSLTEQSGCRGWYGGALFLLICFLVLTISGCGFQVNGSGAADSAVVVASPTAVDFGSVPVGQSANSTVALSNHGSDPVNVSQFKVAGQTFFVNGPTKLPVTIAPGVSQTFQLGFKPSGDTTFSGEFTAMDSAAKPIARGSVRGAGISDATTVPQLTVKPGSLAFGSVSVNSTATLPVTIASTGTGPVTITSAAITGAGFSVSGASFPVTVNPKQTVTLSVQFQPTTAGSATGTLSIGSNASRHTTVAVSLRVARALQQRLQGWQ